MTTLNDVTSADGATVPPCEGALLTFEEGGVPCALLPDGWIVAWDEANWSHLEIWPFSEAAAAVLSERDRQLAEAREDAYCAREEANENRGAAEMCAEMATMRAEALAAKFEAQAALAEADALLERLVGDLPDRFQRDDNGPDVMECATCGRESTVHYKAGRPDPSRDTAIEHSHECSLQAARDYLAGRASNAKGGG